jgi:integrase/recombinase XerD
MPATIYKVLDTRRMKEKTGKYPVKLRVSFERETVNYQTIFDLKRKEEYEKLSKKHIGEHLQEIRDKLEEIEVKARDYAKTLDPFSFSEFEMGFIQTNPFFKARKLKMSLAGESPSEFDYSPYLAKFPILIEQHLVPNCISVVYVSYVKELIRLRQIGSAFNYQSSYCSLKKFKGNLEFRKITVSYLKEFENWHITQGNSKGYVGLILRHLRRVFNLACEAKIIRKEQCYPFGKGKYVIPSKRKRKEALGKEDISQVYYSDIEDEHINTAIAYWLFLYFGHGMNPKDAAKLKYENISGNVMKFDRAKTERTAREDVEPIIVFLTEEIHAIIEKYGSKDRSPDNYIFPILSRGMNPLEEHLRIRAFTGFIRWYIKKAFETLGINKKSSPQQTRVAFINHMRKAGADTEITQKLVGHRHPATTKVYYEDFADAEKRQFTDTLYSFKCGVDRTQFYK